jgi:hypothetical protein
MNYLLRKGLHEIETDSERIVKRAIKKGYVLEDQASNKNGLVPPAPAGPSGDGVSRRKGRKVSRKL